MHLLDQRACHSWVPSVATFHAAAAIGETIARVLEHAARRSSSVITDSTFEFVKDLKTPLQQGVSVSFYRLAVSASRQNFPRRENPDGSRQRTPLVLDLSYLLTGFSRDDPKRQSALLIWAMRVLEDLGELPGSVINQYYGTATPPFRGSETVQLAFESLSMQDQVNIWEPAKQNMQPSIGLLVRAVPIESEVSESSHAPVQTRDFEVRSNP
jgi:hypothetical protein